MAIETAVWRALAVFRTLGLVYAFAVYVRRYDEYAHPVGGWVVLGVMTVWTVVVGVLYSRPAGRRWPVLGLDLAIATAAVMLPVLLDDPARIDAGAQTLPVVWAAAPVLAFAIRGGWPAGLGAAAAVGAADLVQRGELTVPTANNIVLLLLAGAIIGYIVDAGPARRDGPGAGAGGRGRDRASGSGWPATSTTACCRCWRWSAGAAARPGARRPRSAGWPPSRSRRCGRWWARSREEVGGEVGPGRAADGVRLVGR